MMRTLDAARYLSLTTYRRDGRGVDTPVWFAGADGIYYVFSAGDAGKVKRLRRSSSARVAPCDVRGKLLGDWVAADAHLLADAAEVHRALASLRRKYGWQMRLTDVLARLTGRFDRRAYIRVETHDRTQ
jgi:PPOX class probable F420-dependent enzyme